MLEDTVDIIVSSFITLLERLSFAQWRTQKGGLGGSPPEKFWNFRLKNARFLSFETPYPMYFHG